MDGFTVSCCNIPQFQANDFGQKMDLNFRTRNFAYGGVRQKMTTGRVEILVRGGEPFGESPGGGEKWGVKKSLEAMDSREKG